MADRLADPLARAALQAHRAPDPDSGDLPQPAPPAHPHLPQPVPQDDPVPDHNPSLAC